MQAQNRGLTEKSGEVFFLDILSHKMSVMMGMFQQLRTGSSRKQNVRDVPGSLDVTVVASIHFIDLPPVSTSFLGKWLEERPRRVSLRNTAYEGGGNTGLAVLPKTKRFLEAAESEITKSLAHKISRLSWFESPEIQLTFSCR
jgi:hypothetical protein